MLFYNSSVLPNVCVGFRVLAREDMCPTIIMSQSVGEIGDLILFSGKLGKRIFS